MNKDTTTTTTISTTYNINKNNGEKANTDYNNGFSLPKVLFQKGLGGKGTVRFEAANIYKV